MAHALHPNGSQILVKHQDSMMASLARRLEVAKAANNAQLIQQLEQEQQQITANANRGSISRSLTDWFTALKQGLVNLFDRGSELQASHFVNGQDEWWYAFDPRTGECVYADSEAELRLWIKENYHGK